MTDKSKMEKFQPILRLSILISLPILILLIGVSASLAIAKQKKAAGKKEKVTAEIWEVETIILKEREVTTKIVGYGPVRSQREAILTSQVSGQILTVSSSFRLGNFVSKGEELIRIGPKEYQINFKLAQSDLQRAKAELAKLKKEKTFLTQELSFLKEQVLLEQKALKRNQDLAGAKRISEQALESAKSSYYQARRSYVALQQKIAVLPQLLEQAAADVKKNETRLEKAKDDLQKTKVLAPFSGQIVKKSVDVGQQIATGKEIGVLADDSAYEISIQVDPEEIKNIASVPEANLPSSLRDLSEIIGSPKAKVFWNLLRRKHIWNAELVRMEPINQKTRTLPLVVRVENPWKGLRDNQAPLMTGTYCKVEIEGVNLKKAMVIPEKALREDGQIFLIRDQKLVIEEVHVLEFLNREVIISPASEGKFDFGDEVITSTITYPVAGMPLKVRLVEKAKIPSKEKQ